MNDNFYKHLNGESPTGQPEKRFKENEEKEKRAAELIVAEEALKLNQRQLTDIIEFLPDATLAIDKEKRVIIWNKAMEKMASIPAAEMIGKGDHIYTIPFYGKAQPQLMDLVFLDEEEIATRYPTLIRDGDILTAEVFCPAFNNNIGAWFFAKASPLHDQAGNIIGAIESIRDITGLKNAEEEILESKNFLK
jgi:PAS domain-containing protein